MIESAVARRGRPRDSAVDRRVLSAAWDLLNARGYAGLNVDEVAERAAVAKTTLYRRWPTKDHPAVALAAPMLGEAPIPHTRHPRRAPTEIPPPPAPRLHPVRTAGPPPRRPAAG